MIGAFYRGDTVLSLEQINEPTPMPNEVKVKVVTNTICNSTDRKIVTGLRKERFGVGNIIGHESGGIIVEAGSLVTDFSIGDRVASDEWGTYTEFFCTTTDKLQHVPDHLNWDEIALCEIVMKVYQMAAGNILSGDTVVILGQGPAGLLFTQLAKLAGASRIIVTDLYDFKLDRAKTYGAEVAINASEGDPLEAISDALGTDKADVVVEAAGVMDTAKQALRVPSVYGSKIIQFGVVPGEVPYNFGYLHDCGQQIVTIGACNFADPTLPFKRAIQLLSEGKIEVKSFISHRFTLSQINDAFDLVLNRPSEILKIAIENS